MSGKYDLNTITLYVGQHYRVVECWEHLDKFNSPSILSSTRNIKINANDWNLN